MPVEAKIATDAAGIRSAPVQVFDGSIPVPPGSNIALDIEPSAVSGFSREGNDLIVRLKSGDTVRITDFYIDPTRNSHLLFVQEDQLVAADLTQTAGGGVGVSSYVPMDAMAGFAAPAAAEAAGAAAGMAAGASGGALGIGTILSLAGIGGGGLLVAAAAGGGSSETGNPPSPPDTTAPTIATNLAINASGDRLTGVAEAGATVRINTNADGTADYSVTVAADGTFSVQLSPPLLNGESVSVTVRDAAGNTSPATIVNAPDSTLPAQASQLSIAADGTSLSGVGEPGATASLDVDGDGDPVGQTITDSNGAWSFTPATALPDGTVVTATAHDASGNASAPAAASVDASPPMAPVIDASNGTSLSGTAEAGTFVILTDGAGHPIGQVLADASGAWSFSPASPLPDGTVVSAVAQDTAGNTSAAASTVVDSSAPSAPTIDPSNGTFLTGTAEAGTVVTLRDQGGTILGQSAVDASGHWSFVPGSPISDGTVVHAVAQDAAGNTSADASTTIDAIAPPAPTIAPTDGTVVSGTAEAGALVTLTDGNGNPIGQTIADGAGNWTFSPGMPLADGTVVNAIAQDAAGNIGPSASTTVDATAPSAPTIEPSNGTEVSGVAEAGTLLTLTDANGNPIGQVTTDDFGFWSFTPDTPLRDGTVIHATARDAAGNVSSPGTTTVDATPPVAPTIDPTNGREVTGTAEPGSTVILTDGTGNTLTVFSVVEAGAERFPVYSANATPTDLGPPIGEVSVDANGNWIFIPLLPLPDGTVVVAISVDAAGNVGGPVSTVVDGVPPSTPIIDPTSGLILEGTADAGVVLRLTDAFGNLIGQTVADGSGRWSFTPSSPLFDGMEINVVAIDEAGNESLPAIALVDATPPAPPVIGASDGSSISGTAEAGSLVILTDGFGLPIGQTVADANGAWSFTPDTPLHDATVVNAVAQDEAGNISLPATITVDAVAPDSPVLTLLPNGETINGIAEPGSQVRLVIDGDAANAITVTVDGSGNFSVLLTAPLLGGETVEAIAIDAAGNQSAPALLIAPDLAPPTVTVAEVSDGWLNANEAADGIQVEISLRPTMQAGQTVTATLVAQGGHQIQVSHVLTQADLLAGLISLSINPVGGVPSLPQGPATITASIDDSNPSAPHIFVIDTIPPSTPVLSLVAGILGISADPGTQLIVTVDIHGTIASTVMVMDATGLASLNLLTDLDIELDWAQLLGGEVAVSGQDKAGNMSNVATLAVAPSIEFPLTISDFGLAVSLNPVNPQFGLSGTTAPYSTVLIRVVTPALNVEILPISTDNLGHFTLNLLHPSILSQLGLNITDILNLGSQISFDLAATDPQGHQSVLYGLALSPAGLSLNIGQIDVNGSLAEDIMSGANGAEHINGNSGSDLILNIATDDYVLAGPGNDTISIAAINFSTIDGGGGFDTLWIADGIDLDYGPGVGILANIERIDLGSGDSGSVLTLTANEIDAITDANNTLQVTGEANDILSIVGAIDTGTTQTHEGLVYDVYTFGTSSVLVEQNTVQVSI